MSDEKLDIGIAQVVLARLNNERLPRALEMKERVDRGETLNDFDMNFLETVLQDTQQIRSIIDRNPEYEEIAAKMLNLYHEITKKALENENKSSS